MQKKLIALAIAGLSGAAFAQSNVTVYGQADVYAASASADGIKRSTQINSGGLAASRLGFKGVEDLGNGLKAVFTLEYGLAVDANTGVGTGGSTARQQLVGLAGGFGTVAAGRLQTAGYDWGVAYDVLAGTAISPLQNLTTSQGLIGATNATAARANNAVAYISPNLNGLTLAANYTTNVAGAESVTPNGAADGNTRAYLLSGKYDNGPMSVGLVFANGKNDAANLDRKDWALGGSYNFGVATLKATYQQTKDSNAAGIAGNTDKTYSLGVAAPVSAAGTIVASFASTKLDTKVDAPQSNSWTLAYLHGLSKRTTLYTGYNRVSNDNGNSFSIVNNAYGSTLASGATSSVFVAGVNHKF